MGAVKILLILALLYAGLLGLIFLTQSALLFPVRMAGLAPPPPAGAKLLLVREPGGAELHGIHIPPRQASDRGKVTILGFGGNAWNAGALAEYLHDLYPQAGIVAFHYRGYPPSSGRPGAAALIADAPLLFDRAAEATGTSRIVAIGFSIGSGVAASLAPRRPLAGLILVTPFDSLRALAKRHYPWFPPILVRHRIEPAEYLRGTTVPTALIAGETDGLIPPVHARRLAASTGNLVYERIIGGAGHNDIYDSPSFRQAMAEALARIEAKPVPRSE